MSKLFHKLLPYCLNHKLQYLLGMIAVFLSNFLTVRAFVMVGRAVDYILLPGMSTEGLALRLLTIAAFVIGSAVALYYQRILIIGTSRVIEYEIRNDFFRHLTHLSPSFFDHSKTGDLISRATGDIDQVRQALGPGILYPLTAISIIPVSLYAMFAISWPVALISLLPMFLLPFIVSIMANLTYKRSLKIQEHFSDFSGRIQESITGIRVIKSFVQHAHELKTLEKGNAQNATLSMALARVSSCFFPSLITLFLVGVIVILMFSSSYVTTDKTLLAADPKMMSKGDLLGFVLLYRNLFFPVLRLGWVVSALQRASASMTRLLLIWNLKPDIKDNEKTDPDLTKIKGEIEFRDLDFTYPKTQRPSLSDLSFRIEAGKTLGIVGPVGSGKSTIAQIVARLYDPPPGSVLIDGRELHHYPLDTLRASIGMVFQETYLFSDSILNNITFGTPEDTDFERAKAAAHIASVDDDIADFPKAYETRLGERGVNLSGGQKQRVALARAIASDRPILILDDAFAAVDTNTEEEILQRLDSVMAERTTILISHRISTVQMADEIIVLDEGRVAERGSHQELVDKQGLYHDIYQRQLLEKAVEEGSDR